MSELVVYQVQSCVVSNGYSLLRDSGFNRGILDVGQVGCAFVERGTKLSLVNFDWLIFKKRMRRQGAQESL